MLIGELAARSGLSVRTLRFYADVGLLPEAGRSAAGYRLFDQSAAPRARLIRTLRELGVGLADVTRVLSAESSLPDIAASHIAALDTQIRTLRLQRAVLRAAAVLGRDLSTNAEELQRMTDLTTLTAEQRRRILDDYLDAVFGGEPSAVADKMAMGAPDLPDDPTPEQVAAWVELAELVRDPEFVAVSRRMAERARADGSAAEAGNVVLGKAVVEHAGAALRDGIDPVAPTALAVVERVEAAVPGAQGRRSAAERIRAFIDRRVARYWTLVGIVNGWPRQSGPDSDDLLDAWEWYAEALEAHAQAGQARLR